MKPATNPQLARSIKVVLAIRLLAGRAGGAERVVCDLANELARRGLEVEIWHFDEKAGSPFYPLDGRVQLVNMHPGPRRLGSSRSKRLQKGIRGLGRWRFFFPLSAIDWVVHHAELVLWLRRFLQAGKPNLVIAFLPSTFTAALIARTGLPVPVVASVHNVPREDFESADRWDPNPFDRFLRRAMVKRAEGITVLLEEFRSYFAPEIQNRVFVLGNMVDPVADLAAPGLDSPDGNTILSVGRLAKVKDHESLIRAFSLIKHDFPDWRVKIFGNGPLKRDLSDLISQLGLDGAVILMGTTNSIHKEYQAAKIFCLPSYFEGFGLVTAEALSSGLPVVGFADCPGTNSLVSHMATGILANSNDRVGSLACALRELMSDSQKRAAFGAAAPASVAHLTRSKIGDAWVEMIETLTGLEGPACSLSEERSVQLRGQSLRTVTTVRS